MNRNPDSNRGASGDDFAPDAAATPCVMNVALVYEDGATRQWAMNMCGRLTQLAGSNAVQTRSWRLDELTEPQAFTEAVDTANVADVILVSVYAASQLPGGLHSWIDAWLPRRRPGAGTLVALISTLDHPQFRSSLLHDYLRTVARNGHLDFQAHECRASTDPAMGRFEEPGTGTTATGILRSPSAPAGPDNGGPQATPPGAAATDSFPSTLNPAAAKPVPVLPHYTSSPRPTGDH
jgi:hypothetical protein